MSDEQKPKPKLEDLIKAQLDNYEKNKDKINAAREKSVKENPTCLTKWYPIVSQIPGVKTPETAYFYLHYDDQLNALDGKPSKDLLKVVDQLKEKAKEFGYPVFIKNSLFSGKHNWEHACYVGKEEDLLNHFMCITDFAYSVGCEDSLYWVVRKYLKPDALIYTDSKMPVTFERRYFVENGKVTFHHPYWPPHALENQKPSPENWRDLLEVTNHESDEEIALLKELTEKVGQSLLSLSGSWSVDWLKVGSDWYLIDMAEKHKSFIWKDYALGKKGL